MTQQNQSESGAVTQAVLTLFRTAEFQKQNPVESVLETVKAAIQRGKPDVPEFKFAAWFFKELK